jgi:hypothetical protein
VYVVANLVILSLVEHKEQRFMSAIWPVCGLFWAFCWVSLADAFGVIKKIFSIIFAVYIFVEIFSTIQG